VCIIEDEHYFIIAEIVMPEASLYKILHKKSFHKTIFIIGDVKYSNHMIVEFDQVPIIVNFLIDSKAPLVIGFELD
jgi:hypothetical protein